MAVRRGRPPPLRQYPAATGDPRPPRSPVAGAWRKRVDAGGGGTAGRCGHGGRGRGAEGRLGRPRRSRSSRSAPARLALPGPRHDRDAPRVSRMLPPLLHRELCSSHVGGYDVGDDHDVRRPRWPPGGVRVRPTIRQRAVALDRRACGSPSAVRFRLRIDRCPGRGPAELGGCRRFRSGGYWCREILSWPAEWSSLHGIAEIRTPILKISTNTDAVDTTCVVRFLGSGYPEEGAFGLAFPYQARAMPAGRAAAYRRGLENPIRRSPRQDG
jgi:hypothetical protein